MNDPLIVAQFGAVTAAIGYCAKLVVQWIELIIERQNTRRSRLIELQSLLLASRSAFRTQKRLIKELCDEIKKADKKIGSVGYDEILAGGYSGLSTAQKLRHGLIRSYTMKAFLPLNTSMMGWLSRDQFFKSQSDKLGFALRQLEAHLVLWRAKYEFWIPERPERALVFLADEEKHGVGFPTGIEDLVLKKTGTAAAVSTE